MAEIIDDLAPRPLIDNGLVSLEARTLLAFECADGDAAEFDSAHGLPGRIGALDDFDSVKTRILERLEKQILAECAADASAPEMLIVLQFLRHILIADDVAYHASPAVFQNTEHLVEQLLLLTGVHEIQNT